MILVPDVAGKRPLKVVTIGGGTGHHVLLTGIKERGYDITAIVSMADDGGSTGVLRDELGVLPPGDVRQCLTALSQDPGIMRELFTYRFSDGALKGKASRNSAAETTLPDLGKSRASLRYESITHTKRFPFRYEGKPIPNRCGKESSRDQRQR